MSPLDNFNDNYYDVINKKIKIRELINGIFSKLKDSPDKSIEFEVFNVLNKLILNDKGTLKVLKSILITDKNQFIKLIIAKLLIENRIDNELVLLKKQIKSEFSAIFITSLYKFLSNNDNELNKKIIQIIIEKYEQIYEVISEEAQFFLDLETALVENSNHIDFNIGYFTKFKTDNLEILKNDNYHSYLIKNSHIIALDLSRWEINKLPNSICLLKKLRYLNLSNLNLISLPESIKLIPELSYINLSGNNLIRIPQWLTEFSTEKLQQKYIEEKVNQAEAKVLGVLEILKGSKLEKVSIETQVIHWEFAHNFKIDDNGNIIGIYINNEKAEIGLFPENLCTLMHLQELVLSNSSIKSIPNCIGELQALKYLDFSFNRIQSIPESINKLSNLEYLNLNENEISEKALLSIPWNKSGQIYINNGEYDKAIVECKETLELFPKNKGALLHLGIAYKEKGDYSLAETIFKKFLEIEPSSSIVLGYLSDIYHTKGEYSKTITILKQAIEIDPEEPVLWSNLGFNFKKLGKYDEAIDFYLHSLEINPKNHHIWKDLASIYRDKGDYMKAIEADERALEIELNYNKDDLE